MWQRHEHLVLFNWAWVLVLGRSDLQAEFWQIQVMAGADECGKAMWIVRGGHGRCQKFDEGGAVAGVGGESQQWQ